MPQIRGSILVSKELIEMAFDLASPTIEMLLGRSKKEGAQFVHVVVMNPIYIEGATFDEDVLAERTFGPAPEDKAKWPWQYDDIAAEKAQLSRRTGKATSVLVAEAPALLKLGDVYYPGGVCLAGIPVGTSGIESVLDEAISNVVASVINGLVKEDLADAEKKDVVYLE